jgi:thiopeptide-type bacteriocin biosynthesis protein
LTWLSAQLFFRPDPELAQRLGDRILLEVVEPFVRRCQQRGWIQQYFFIRYKELGSHVRLRLQGDPEVLAREVRPALEEAVGLEGEPWVDNISSVHPVRHEILSHVRWLPYEPEFERYGGPEGVEVAEAFFQASSEAALHLLRSAARDGNVDPAVRSAKALLAMTVLLHTMSEGHEHAVALARSYSQYALDIVYKVTPGDPGEAEEWHQAFDEGRIRQSEALFRAVRALWEVMGEDEELPSPLDEYRAGLRRVRHRLGQLLDQGVLIKQGRRPEAWREVVEMLVPSYLHMMNNRLGLSILDESYLGHLAGSLLAQEAPDVNP